MKRIVLMNILWLMMFSASMAIMQPVSLITAESLNRQDFKPLQLHIHGDNVYFADDISGFIQQWSISKNRIVRSELIYFSPKSGLQDIYSDDRQVYLLSAKYSSIMVFRVDGSPVREIVTKGIPEIAFHNPVRLVVNHQGLIYVLDTGRKEILAFSNEGMFVGKLRILGALSMSLGEDQDLRVIRAIHGKYVLTRIDAELVLIEECDLEDLIPSKDRIADFGINGFGQIYFINAKSDQIGKLNSNSRFIPHAYYGVRSKRISPISFADPRRIKVSTIADRDHIAVLDARQKAIKIFAEKDIPNSGRLIRPERRSRPELAKTSMPRIIDYLAADSLTYIIQNGLNKKRKENRQLICKNADGQIVFGVNALTHKKKGLRSFDALALGESRIFVLDSKAHRVHIFDRFKGFYLGSFGAKGAGRGEWRNPGGITSDGSGKIFVADKNNRRISIWNEAGEYLNGIDLSKHKLKPRQIRISADGIYILGNRGELVKILIKDNTLVLLPIAKLPNIASFDLFEKGRIGLINRDNQQLIILDPDTSKPFLVQDVTQYRYVETGRYFAAQAGAAFPYFENIDLIRYDTRIKTLFISDTSLKSTRILKFHSSLSDK